MADKKISQATPKLSLEAGDMLPVAGAGDDETYHITGQALFDSLPRASSSAAGMVELATQAEVAAAEDASRAVTPAALAGALGPRCLAAGWCFIGALAAPLTRSKISAAFLAAFGRAAQQGDLCTALDSESDLFILAWNAAAGAWEGMNASQGANVRYV